MIDWQAELRKGRTSWSGHLRQPPAVAALQVAAHLRTAARRCESTTSL